MKNLISLETDINSHHPRPHRHHGKGEVQHQRLQHHQEPAVQAPHQQHRFHRQRPQHKEDSIDLVDQGDQGSHQELETGIHLHPVQRDHQNRHQGRVSHQDSREHQGQGAHSHHHRMNGSHRRHSGQHRLGWLPLLCLQGIFQLLPEALGQSSPLLHQDQLSTPLYIHRDQPQHHLQPLTLDIPHLDYLPHQPHYQHHSSLQPMHHSHLLHPIIQPPVQQDLSGVVQHQQPCPACHLHLQLTVHPQRQPLLPGSASLPQHLLRICDHHLALWRTMKHSSMHHHHNDLMTTTPLSELKSQGIVSSQTQRQAELTSRSSQGLMQWSSAAEHLVSGKQPSSCQSISCIHLCRQAELTSRITFVLEGSETSEPEVDDYIIKKTSGDRHQEGRSSSTMAIRSSRRVEFCHQVEEHQSVIVLDYIFLTDPHHDIARRVSSNIKQPESSSGDPSHPRIISLGIIVEHISAFFVTKGGHLALVFIIRSAITLLHQHQVWRVHLRWLQAFHLCLRLLYVHHSPLSVLDRPQLHHIEDRDRPSQSQRKCHCRMFFILHLSTHLHVHQKQPLQQDGSSHLAHHLAQHQVFHHLQRYHQIVHHDLEAERGNHIMVIIFKLDMNITEEKKDISLYVHQHPHLLQSPISAINFNIVNHIVDHIISASVENPKTIIWSSSIRTQVSSTAAMLIHLRDLIALLSSHLRLATRTRTSLGIHPTSSPDTQT